MGRAAAPAATRRRSARPADDAQARRSRALEEPMDVGWLQSEPYLIALVRNPLHGTRYHAFAPDLAHLDDALCTCPDFALRGPARCKHLEALRLWREAHPGPLAVPSRAGPDTARLWGDVERSDGSAPTSLRTLRARGRLLIDGRAPPPGG